MPTKFTYFLVVKFTISNPWRQRYSRISNRQKQRWFIYKELFLTWRPFRPSSISFDLTHKPNEKKRNKRKKTRMRKYKEIRKEGGLQIYRDHVLKDIALIL